MPELAEVEYYRRLAETALHRKIAKVDAPDAWFLKAGLTASALRRAVVGRSFTAARRIGKLLLLDTDGDTDGPVLGLRFGMTGVLLVDGSRGVDELVYSSMRDEPAWDRVTFRFADGGDLRVRDPRRLGGVLLDPDEAILGADAQTITLAALRAALTKSRTALKARLMDQAKLAGVGNLAADELLWRAGLDPARPAGELTDDEVKRLHRHLKKTFADLLEQGGSHTGRLQAHRVVGGRCPKDGTPLVRRTIGGRTTWSCPRHQR
jgi:formamidopyrimidine-DNA glycosylase